MRVIQPAGERGSLKWIQRAVNEDWPSLNDPITKCTNGGEVKWLSPLQSDDFAEYRDEDFLRKIGQEKLASALKTYWPARGPQWDALGRTSNGDVLLVEAKAHIGELCSPGTAASADSRSQIEAAFENLRSKLRTNSNGAPWTGYFYQLANRVAHLDLLRTNGVSAWLILVNFLGARDVKGPLTTEAWEAAYEVAFHVIGLTRRNALSPYILHVYPNVPNDAA